MLRHGNIYYLHSLGWIRLIYDKKEMEYYAIFQGKIVREFDRYELKTKAA